MTKQTHDWEALLRESFYKTQIRDTTLESLMEKIDAIRRDTAVSVKEASIYDSDFWFYDDYNGEVLNRKRSFFSIKGLRYFVDDTFITEQPMIIQPEIGYLGILCAVIDGVLCFLMQAKIEPGNVNCVQISPTIQATKSNFTRAHGGKLPLYFDFFENAARYTVLYDQVQSEQGTRFYQKRNRNLILYVDGEVPVHPNFMWMTLGQIAALLTVDNLVNMDTRTVLAGLPFFADLGTAPVRGKNVLTGAHSSMAADDGTREADPAALRVSSVFSGLNSYKMMHNVKRAFVPLNQLVDWRVDEYGITCKKPADFMIRYYDIAIEGREVQHWTQPLFKATASAVFGLLCVQKDGAWQYLVRLKPEIGSFDAVEIGPTVQWDGAPVGRADSIAMPDDAERAGKRDAIEALFAEKMQKQEGILVDVILSEEGGRFYHEQNRNLVIEVSYDALPKELPEGYLLVDLRTLKTLTLFFNCLNIQMRSLLTLVTLRKS